jgi:hypothetical protein
VVKIIAHRGVIARPVGFALVEIAGAQTVEAPGKLWFREFSAFMETG